MIYQEWINNRVKTEKEALGNCYVVCNEMILVFPELELVKGYYYDLSKKKTHYWLELNGRIIDPTILQFDTINGTYERYKLKP